MLMVNNINKSISIKVKLSPNFLKGSQFDRMIQNYFFKQLTFLHKLKSMEEDMFNEEQFFNQAHKYVHDPPDLYNYLRFLYRKTLLKLLTLSEFTGLIQQYCPSQGRKIFSNFKNWMLQCLKNNYPNTIDHLRFPWYVQQIVQRQTPSFISSKIESFLFKITPQNIIKKEENFLSGLDENDEIKPVVKEKRRRKSEDISKQTFFQVAARKNQRLVQNSEFTLQNSGQKLIFQEGNSNLEIPDFFLVQSSRAIEFLLAFQFTHLFAAQLDETKKLLLKHLRSKNLSKMYTQFLQIFNDQKKILKLASLKDEAFHEKVCSYQTTYSKSKLQDFDYVRFWQAVKEQCQGFPPLSESDSAIQNKIEEAISVITIVFMPTKVLYGVTLRDQIIINTGIQYSPLLFSERGENFSKLLVTFFFVMAIHQITHYLLRRIKQFNIQIFTDDSFRQEINLLQKKKTSFGGNIYLMLTDFYWSCCNEEKDFFEKIKQSKSWINEKLQKRDLKDYEESEQIVNKILERKKKYSQLFQNIEGFGIMISLFRSNKVQLSNILHELIRLLQSCQQSKTIETIEKSNYSQGSFQFYHGLEEDSTTFAEKFIFSQISLAILQALSYQTYIIRSLQQYKKKMSQGEKMLTQIIIESSKLMEILSSNNQDFKQITIFLKSIVVGQAQQIDNLIEAFDHFCSQIQEEIHKFVQIFTLQQVAILSSPEGQSQKLQKHFQSFTYFYINKRQKKSCILFSQITQIIDKWQIFQKKIKYRDLLSIYDDLPPLITAGKDNICLQAGQQMYINAFPNHFEMIYLKDYEMIQAFSNWKNIGVRPRQIVETKWNLKMASKEGNNMKNSINLSHSYCYHYYQRFVEPQQKKCRK